jgi:hypothetical protein
MTLYDAPGDIETESDAPSVVLRDLNVALENSLEFVGRDPDAVVVDSESQLFSDALDADSHRPTSRRELDRVAEKVDEHLENPRSIERNERQRRNNL